MTRIAMVVMEPDSEWPGQIGDSTSLVAFCEGGEDLLCKTQMKIGALHRSQQDVRVVVLACNGATGGTASGHRAKLARVLLGAVTRTICGRLILSASGRASHPLRQELLALAGELTRELPGTTAAVSVHFAGVPGSGLRGAGLPSLKHAG